MASQACPADSLTSTHSPALSAPTNRATSSSSMEGTGLRRIFLKRMDKAFHKTAREASLPCGKSTRSRRRESPPAAAWPSRWPGGRRSSGGGCFGRPPGVLVRYALGGSLECGHGQDPWSFGSWPTAVPGKEVGGRLSPDPPGPSS